MSRNGIIDHKRVNRRWKYDQEWDLIEFPNADRLVYCEVPDAPRKPKHKHHHTYWIPRDGKDGWERDTQIEGGSSLSKAYDLDPERLLNWKERVTLEGVAWLYGRCWEDLTWLRSGEAIKAKLVEETRTADDIRDQKGDVGTRAHGVLEALAAGESPEAQDGYGQAVINWWRDRKPEVLNCEQFVYSATHGYAGRFDLRAQINALEMGHLKMNSVTRTWLVDLKTSGWIAPSMHVQLALYELAAKECGVGSSDERLILQVKDDGTYREVPCRATEDDALACIQVYRGAGRIERESGLPKAKAA